VFLQLQGVVFEQCSELHSSPFLQTLASLH
jgi:hypothetical protein